MKLLRPIAVAVLAAALLIALGFPFRRTLILWAFALSAPQPELEDPVDEGAGVRWFDDYYTIERIDESTIAIGEPRYWQANFNYLIVGTERALLFDSGPGVRDIRPLVESLTPLPLTAVPSHFHYDHVGNHSRFESVAMIDLPHLRARVRNGILQPTRAEHLGHLEGFERPGWSVSEWWAPGSEIDLGSRRLRVFHTPGHTFESISLYDAERGLLFTGDYIHDGTVIAFVPGSSLPDYLTTAERLVASLPPGVRLLTAHRALPPGAPVLDWRHLEQLRELLLRIRDGTATGEGLFPRVFHVNARLTLVTDFEWMADWE